MNNFIFENSTKAIFGKGCVKEYLRCLLNGYGNTVMLAYGGGSIKKNGANQPGTYGSCLGQISQSQRKRQIKAAVPKWHRGKI